MPSPMRLSFREHQLNLEPDLPVGSVVGSNGVVVGRELRVHRQLAQMKDLADAAADWNGPLLAAGRVPIDRSDRRAGEIEAALEVVVDEGLDETVVVGAAAFVAGHRPDV